MTVAPLSVKQAAGNSQVSFLTSYRKWTDGRWTFSAAVLVDRCWENYLVRFNHSETCDTVERCAFLVSYFEMICCYMA